MNISSKKLLSLKIALLQLMMRLQKYFRQRKMKTIASTAKRLMPLFMSHQVIARQF
jgi:hypothetical protein